MSAFMFALIRATPSPGVDAIVEPTAELAPQDAWDGLVAAGGLEWATKLVLERDGGFEALARVVRPVGPSVDDSDGSYPCSHGTCDRWIRHGMFCAGCLVHCDLDEYFPQEPADLSVLFPQTAEHDAISEAFALRLLSEVA
jgi:hypothetical protein